ncbi:MAG TPA: hypothetical protein G4O00_12425 [Thermoflexia bacterium]|jgi:hypothetical protein|nr:hypothetical protein [Thermoflexia bacterium]
MKPKVWIPILVTLLVLSSTSIALAFPAEGVYRNFADIVEDGDPTETMEPTATMEPTSTPEPQEHIEFEGEVEAVNGDGSYVIAGQTVLTDENTRFKPSAEAVVVGVWVEVEAAQQADGSLLALEIEVKMESPGEDEHGAEVEFEGTVEAIDDNLYTIAGQVVMVSADTVFKPDQASITVGAWVEVKAFALADGSLLARKIELEHTGMPGDDEVEKIEFRGVVEAMDGNFITVAGMVVDISAAIIKDGTLQVGIVVEVEAKRLADGSIVAIEIEVEGSHDGGGDEYRPHVEFEGTVEAINGSIYIVSGVTVDGSSATIEHGPIAVGDKVKVEGTEQPDGSVLAVKIHKITDSEEGAKVEFTAIVQAMDGSTITFDNGLTVTVDGNTMIDESHGPLQVGARVEVKAREQNGVLLALRIEVEDED